jgi:hypothetical protein
MREVRIAFSKQDNIGPLCVALNKTKLQRLNKCKMTGTDTLENKLKLCALTLAFLGMFSTNIFAQTAADRAEFAIDAEAKGLHQGVDLSVVASGPDNTYLTIYMPVNKAVLFQIGEDVRV